MTGYDMCTALDSDEETQLQQQAQPSSPRKWAREKGVVAISGGSEICNCHHDDGDWRLLATQIRTSPVLPSHTQDQPHACLSFSVLLT